MEQEKKPDLTSAKNLINYLIYTFAGVIAVLFWQSENKSKTSLENCEKEKMKAQNINEKLLLDAYQIKTEEIQKKAEEIDSLSVEKLKEQAEPTLKKIKNYTSKK